MVAIGRPFGVSRDLAERRPWVSVAGYLPEHARVDLYGGFAYVVVGRRPAIDGAGADGSRSG